MSKELTFEREYGPEDFLFVFVYEIEPYNAGGKDEPPSGGYALVTEIRNKDGVVLPQEFWKACGLDICRIEEDIYEYHGEMEKGRWEDAQERDAEARREARLLDKEQD